jgi:D-glutamate N-acetyltransferase
MTHGKRRYAILTEGYLTDRHAKTAHGVMQYGRDEVVAIVDSAYAGKDAIDVMPHLGRSCPIVATAREALALRPTSLLLGVATAGGVVPPAFRLQILDAIDAGVEIVSGLHQFLNDDMEFVDRAQASGAGLWDVRAAPEGIPLFTGEAYRVPQTVVLAVGSDCAIGKMTVMLELERAGKDAGARPEFVATGQTGILIAGKGIAVDRVISDFVTGAAERLVLSVDPGTDVTLVEGQGSILHPAYAPVTLGLLYGSAPDFFVLCHDAARSSIEEFDVPIPDLKTLAAMHEAWVAPIKPARCIAVALNTRALDERAARAAIAGAERDTGLPADDVVRFGAGKLWRAIAEAAA